MQPEGADSHTVKIVFRKEESWFDGVRREATDVGTDGGANSRGK